MKNRSARTSLVFLAVLLLLSPVAAAQDQPRTGGVLKAAMIGEPPSLDLHWTTAVITQQITWHVYETLFTYDQQFTPYRSWPRATPSPTAGFVSAAG